MADFELVEGDQDPSVSVTLKVNGSPLLLDAANNVDRVEARLCNGTAKTILPATITDTANGKVRLDFPATGLVAGTYTVDWVVIYTDDHTRTFKKNSADTRYVISVLRRC